MSTRTDPPLWGARELSRRARAANTLEELEAEVVQCRRCPRLVAWREKVATVKRASFADEQYWGRPVPGFGDPTARLLILGLAPAAHGGNRTGRMFTGDRSGDFLFASLYRTGYVNQPHSVSSDDGLRLHGCYITASVRCAPPDNKPTTIERDNCSVWLTRELALLRNVRVVVCLGGFAWTVVMRQLNAPRPRQSFGHGVETSVGALTLLASYHVSQQNTFTGRLTEPMLDAIFTRARELCEL